MKKPDINEGVINQSEEHGFIESLKDLKDVVIDEITVDTDSAMAVDNNRAYCYTADNVLVNAARTDTLNASLLNNADAECVKGERSEDTAYEKARVINKELLLPESTGFFLRLKRMNTVLKRFTRSKNWFYISIFAAIVNMLLLFLIFWQKKQLAVIIERLP